MRTTQKQRAGIVHVGVLALLACATQVQAQNIVGIGIDGSNNLVFVWYDNMTVSAGSSRNLSSKRALYSYQLPQGKSPQDIVGMGIDDGNHFVFAWYRDGTVSAGSSRDLGSRRSPRSYRLAPGKTPNDIVDVGIDGSNHLVVAWYRDGTVSYGSSTDLSSKRAPTHYTLPPGKTPEDILGIGVDGFIYGEDGDDFEMDLVDLADAALSGDDEKREKELLEGVVTITRRAFGGRGSLCFAWYRDGTVSAGSSTNLAEVRAPYGYTR